MLLLFRFVQLASWINLFMKIKNISGLPNFGDQLMNWALKASLADYNWQDNWQIIYTKVILWYIIQSIIYSAVAEADRLTYQRFYARTRFGLGDLFTLEKYLDQLDLKASWV